MQLTQEQIQAHAEERGISFEEAKAELEAKTALETRAQEEGKTIEELVEEEKELTGLINKYGGDPVKMAKALKSSAQEVTKIIERQKALEREKEELEQRFASLAQANAGGGSQQPAEEKIKENLKRKYPTLDDDIIDAMVEQQLETAKALRTEYLIDKAYDRIEIEKEALKDDPYYKKYKAEIDDLIEKQPIQAKLQRGIVKRCRDLIVGQHIDEVLAERKSRPVDKDIVGQIKGSKPRVTGIGGGQAPALTPRQAKQAADMGIKAETYLSLLKKHRERAKKDGLPEPELLTDPWRK